MAQEPDSDSRPITVEELIARTSADAAFPRSGAPSARREGPAAAKNDEGGRTASGMPAYTPPAQNPQTPAPRARTVGASGMPSYVPAAPVPEEAESATTVTGIIPVVSDDGAAFEPFDTGSLRAVERDDLLGEDLPTGEQPATPFAVATTFPATAVLADVTVAGDLAGENETTGAIAVVGEESAVRTVPSSEDDDDGADHLASAGELAAAEQDTGTGSAAAPDEDRAHRRSPVWGWLGLVGEVILGLVIGAGLFWGFTVLWKEYVYFALVLAVLVIFAVVTFAYVLRKRDLPTTLLALAVGLIVTIGPLVLLV